MGFWGWGVCVWGGGGGGWRQCLPDLGHRGMLHPCTQPICSCHQQRTGLWPVARPCLHSRLNGTFPAHNGTFSHGALSIITSSI